MGIVKLKMGVQHSNTNKQVACTVFTIENFRQDRSVADEQKPSIGPLYDP